MSARQTYAQLVFQEDSEVIAPPSDDPWNCKPEIRKQSRDFSRETYTQLDNDDDDLLRRTRIEKLREKLEEKRQEEAEILAVIQKVKPKFESKRESLLNEIAIFEAEIIAADDTIHRIESGPEAEPPPGPKSLRWVEGHFFLAIATIVIVANIFTIVLETMDQQYEEECYLLDQSFMVFYILEIWLKAQLWRHRLLFDSESRIWWNWLDLTIVVTGVIDMYVQPALVFAGVVNGSSNTFSHISRFIRFLRLLRILKIVRVFIASDLEWTHQPRFQLFIMGVIGVNSIVMGFETDMPSFKGWYYVEQLFLVIFTFELLVRLKYQGLTFFTDPDTMVWNYIDFVIVVGGIVDQWAMPTIAFIKTAIGMGSGESASNVGQIMMMLRMLRLLRLLRLVRLVKNIPPLFNLVVGIVQAVQGMVWVLVLTATFLYVSALLCVRLFGHGLAFGGEAPEEVAAIFPNVSQSFFVLFKLMNGDGDAIEPLMIVMPLTKVFFVFFMVVSTWAILSILTAVVSENMISTTEAHREEWELQREEDRRQFTNSKLQKIFLEMDKDASMTLTRSEFMEFIEDPVCAEELKHVARNSLDEQDLLYLFNTKRVMSESGDAKEDFIHIQDFTEALARNDDAVKQRAVFRLNNRLTCLSVAVRQNMMEMMETVTGNRSSNGFKQKTVRQFLDSQDCLDTNLGLTGESTFYEKSKRLRSFKQKSVGKAAT